MREVIADAIHEFRRHKSLADRAIEPLSDADFFHRPAEQVNSLALIVKHVGGNLLSRWTDFLSTDGEKSDRDRDAEFVLASADTRKSLIAAWDLGWAALFGTLDSLEATDLEKQVTIRGEKHTVIQAVIRGLTHAAYHTGQILYLARLWKPDAKWLTIAPGQSRAHRAGYRKPP